MTVSETEQAPAWVAFDTLSTRELDVLQAITSAAWRTVSAVHPLLCPLWHDLAEDLHDLNEAWWHAFERENPGRTVTRS
jgi:hypothetical protein